MRALAFLIGCAVLAASGEAVAGIEWVVLRVERVEVAVARADGSPWDDGPIEVEKCRMTGAGSFHTTQPRTVARKLCIDELAGADPGAPDLFVRLVSGSTRWYATPVAPDRIAHAFGAAFLVPLDAVGPDGVALEVGDQDGLRSDTAELLGRIKLTRRDFRDLLASAARQKTRSDGSVTRLEISARRYRRGRGGTVRLDDRNRAALSPVRFVAGESIMLRARGREDVVAIVGGQLTSFTIGRCSRAVVRSAGGAVVALEGADEPAVVTISIEKPTLKLWRAAVPSADCDGGGTRRSSTATVSALTISSNVASPSADQVRKVVEHRYLEGIRRCHERVLRTDATAVGSVRVLYRIAATGSSNFINVNGFDSTVDTCIESIIGKWRFAAPKDTAGQPTSADVDLQLAL